MSSQRSAFPLEPAVDAPEPQPRVVHLFTEEGDRMLDALGSETARAILAALDEEPATTTDVADRADTSLQNAHYHLDQLEAADLVQVVGTHYSTRGSEMDVYAPAHDPLVFVGGDEVAEAVSVDRDDGDDGGGPTAYAARR